jgi:hypothetical protein
MIDSQKRPSLKPVSGSAPILENPQHTRASPRRRRSRSISKPTTYGGEEEGVGDGTCSWGLAPGARRGTGSRRRRAGRGAGSGTARWGRRSSSPCPETPARTMRRTAVGAGACRRQRWQGGRWGRRRPLGWVGFGLVCRSETPAGGGTGDMWKERVKCTGGPNSSPAA